MTLKHPMPTIRHNPQRSTINHNKLTNYPPQCIPHTYGCTIANMPLLLLPHSLSPVQIPTPTVTARPRRTAGRGRRKPLRAVRWWR